MQGGLSFHTYALACEEMSGSLRMRAMVLKAKHMEQGIGIVIKTYISGTWANAMVRTTD